MDTESKQAVGEATIVAGAAALRRRRLRRSTKPGDEKRERELALTIDALRRAMAPIRSAIGKFPYQRFSDRDEQQIRAASEALKYERKQIRKMQRS